MQHFLESGGQLLEAICPGNLPAIRPSCSPLTCGNTRNALVVPQARSARGTKHERTCNHEFFSSC